MRAPQFAPDLRHVPWRVENWVWIEALQRKRLLSDRSGSIKPMNWL